METPTQRGQKRDRETAFSGGSPVSPSKRGRFYPPLPLVDSEVLRMQQRMRQALVSYFCTHVASRDGAVSVEAILQHFAQEGLADERFTAVRNEVFADCLKTVRTESGDVHLAFNHSSDAAPETVDWMALFASAQQHLKQESARVAAFKPEIEKILAQRTELQSQVNVLQHKVEELDADLGQARAVLAQTIKEASDMQAELIQEQRDSDALGVVKLARQQTSQSVAAAAGGTKQAEDDLMRENTGLHHQLSEMEQDLAAKTKELASKDAVMTKMAEDLAKQRERKKRAECEQIKALQDRCDTLQSELKDANATKEKLLRACKELEKQMEALRADLHEAIEFRDQRGRDLEAALKRTQESEAAQIGLRHEVGELKASNNHRLAKVADQVLAYEKAEAKLVEDVRELKAQLETERHKAEQTRKTAAEEADELRRQRDSLQQRLSEVEADAQQTEQDLNDAHDAKTEAMELYQQTRVKAERLEAENSVLKLSKEELEDKAEDLQLSLDDAEAEIDVLEAEQKRLLAVRKGFDIHDAQGRFAVFDMKEQGYWIGLIDAAHVVPPPGRALVDVVWHQVAGNQGIRVVSPAQYKPLEKGIRTDQIVATFLRAPNTAEQYEQLLDSVKSL